jgi:hypothetical protein
MRHVVKRNDGSDMKKQEASKYGGLYAASKGRRIRENYDSKFIKQMKQYQQINDQQKKRNKAVSQSHPKVTRSMKNKKNFTQERANNIERMRLKRIEDKEFEQILKTDAIRFRNSTMKYHENIARNQESIMVLESDTRQKLFTLKNIRSICNQVHKNVKLTEQTVSKKYEELILIWKQNEHNILKNKIDQNNHKRKSFRARHYSNKLHNRNRNFERINRGHHEYIFMAHETSGMSSQLPGIEEEDEISVNSSDDGPNPNNILNQADPSTNFEEVPNDNESLTTSFKN